MINFLIKFWAYPNLMDMDSSGGKKIFSIYSTTFRFIFLSENFNIIFLWKCIFFQYCEIILNRTNMLSFQSDTAFSCY